MARPVIATHTRADPAQRLAWARARRDEALAEAAASTTPGIRSYWSKRAEKEAAEVSRLEEESK